MKTIEGNKLIADFMRNEPKMAAWRGNVPQYDTSWDWLILVVQNIYCLEIEEEPVLIIRDALADASMKGTYDAVVEFIQWYNNGQGWEVTDPSCNQMRKTILEDEVYLFKEDRIINPTTGEKETFELQMDIKNYNWSQIVDGCDSFGYDAMQVDKWITEGEETALILECLFELEN